MRTSVALLFSACPAPVTDGSANSHRRSRTSDAASRARAVHGSAGDDSTGAEGHRFAPVTTPTAVSVSRPVTSRFSVAVRRAG